MAPPPSSALFPYTTLFRSQLAAVGLEFFLRPPAFRDVADVALHHPVAIDLIDVADKLHVDGLAGAGFQRQVFVADIGFALQFPELRLGCLDILDRKSTRLN